MRDELLALLEDGPKAQSQLADWLGLGLHVVGRTLREMQGDGQVKRIGADHWWALPSHQPRPGGRPRKQSVSVATLTRVENVAIAPPANTHPMSDKHISSMSSEKRRGRFRLARVDAAAEVDRLLGIVEPCSGTAVCAGCGTRFTPLSEAERTCSDRCAAAPPPSRFRIVIIDGQEYLAESIGSQAVTRDWSGGSPLDGLGARVHKP